jgi:hypothetical protein
VNSCASWGFDSDALARHQLFEATFARLHAGKFVSFAVLEEKFRDYHTKDFGSTVQQVSGD